MANAKEKKNGLIVNKNGDSIWYLNGKKHREDGPAVEKNDGTKEWLVKGKLHRDNDLPAVERSNGTREWWFKGNLHRIGNPAIIHYNGKKEWYHKGLKHRDNGPAIEYVNGGEEWYQDGKRHREDGPALNMSLVGWYVEGHQIEAEEVLYYQLGKQGNKDTGLFFDDYSFTYWQIKGQKTTKEEVKTWVIANKLDLAFHSNDKKRKVQI